jgi:hypothetical protein
VHFDAPRRHNRSARAASHRHRFGRTGRGFTTSL